MIVTSAVRHAAAGSAAMLLVLSAPVAGAATPPRAPVTAPAAPAPALGPGSVTEPTPPARRFVDRARLDRDGTQVQPLAGAPAVPTPSALSWVVADAGTGEVLAARAAHRKLPPASTLKTLFALTVLPHHEASERHTVADEELKGIGEGSSLVGVKEGYTYRVSDLWNGVFLSSGNDAVHVLAAMSGGWESTARQMQEKARSLGARDTHVVSPDGYDAPGQVSSAYDLAVFGRAGVRDPEFTRYCSTAYADFPAGSWSYGIANTNRLVTGADGVGRYPGIIGVKNGYTSNAGNTLVAAARRGDRTLVVSVMNPQAGGGLAVYEEARDLLDWGFAAAGKVEPVGSLLPPRSEESAGSQAARGPAGEKRPDARGVSVRGGGGAPAAALGASAARPGTAADASADAGPSVALPLSLVGSACAAALALWAWRRRLSRA
ncbi:D-alanyl-D-alanine carboxypeptidase [Streptomyces sp. R302]|uniref:D-alanyl-D-alanine carboxypeptidase family protein n=1 Tax=unclassified Streptomyces TaxID=2593676 RepID=UPI00145EB2CB|nr:MULTISPECIES: D-alanyl-D-alanine carboxypeptidase [unclassified Streptomyces]NML55224.1 D-alanyl-D-alanine carboxypeptidase [Streptomyces sp. R301]NML82644.1 D-alanyl-D-alanine carboxypeptidase [Streptomyces sp. R302]